LEDLGNDSAAVRGGGGEGVRSGEGVEGVEGVERNATRGMELLRRMGGSAEEGRLGGESDVVDSFGIGFRWFS
jgi:hypothetical protein